MAANNRINVTGSTLRSFARNGGSGGCRGGPVHQAALGWLSPSGAQWRKISACMAPPTKALNTSSPTARPKPTAEAERLPRSGRAKSSEPRREQRGTTIQEPVWPLAGRLCPSPPPARNPTPPGGCQGIAVPRVGTARTGYKASSAELDQRPNPSQPPHHMWCLLTPFFIHARQPPPPAPCRPPQAAFASAAGAGAGAGAIGGCSARLSCCNASSCQRRHWAGDDR